MVDRKPKISRISSNAAQTDEEDRLREAWRLLSDNMRDLLCEFIEKLAEEKTKG